jgi:MFS family permease
MAEPAAASPEVPVDPVTGRPLRWYQGLDRYCWVVLIIAALGWLFDTMDQNLFTLVRAPSLKELLHPHPENQVLTPEETDALNKDVRFTGFVVTAIFIVGWATGGWVFGILGDRLGRTKTMIYTILVYAIFTGASGLVNNWWLYALMRFMTGLGVGGEWAAGASLVAEVFPARSKPMALGLLQALSAVGNMMASVVTLGIGNLDTRWRWAYFVGFVPALLVLWIRRSVKEPEQWKEAKERASLGKELGSIGQIFTHPILRRNTIAAVLMAMAGGIALWGAGFFSTDSLREELRFRANEIKVALEQKGELQKLDDELKREGLDNKSIGNKVSIMFFLQNAGSFFGIYLFAVFSERTSRKRAFYLWFALAWASVLWFFWGLKGSGGGAYGRALILAPIMGFCTLGPFSGYTLYFPYLYPTRLRATGCGFCYNVARYLVAVGVMALGGFGVALGGFAVSATIVSFIYILGFIGTWLGPETKGRPLPEDKDFEVAPEAKPATS